MLRIALFSDIHGEILLPFKLVDLYQKETGEKVDLILQCGDLGAYPDPKNFDKATMKHAQSDRDELGFAEDFMIDKAEMREFLDRLNIDMICVRGNHEDHEYLDQLEKEHSDEPCFPIDVYKRVFIVKSGVPQKFEKGSETLSFAGVGRIGDRKGRSNSRYIQDYERKAIQALSRSKEDFDVLISHDKRSMGPDDYGTAEVGTLLDKVIFPYHFYGHTGEDFKVELDSNGITKSCKIKELEYEQNGVLPASSMVILEKDEAGKMELKVVAQKLTNQLGKHNWKY
jgi:predicted phosphodiesterase